VAGVLATERLYQEVPAWTEQLAALVEGADPGTPVPTTPGWTLVELCGHVGYAFRWMTTIVATRATAPVRRRDTKGRRAPDDPAQLPGWLREGAVELVDAVGSVGPSTPVWSWAGGQQPAEWWLQRMLYELVVHVADAALAVGEPATIDASLAAAGIDEWLAIVPFVHDDMTEALPAGRSMHLHAANGGEWLLRGTPDGLAWERGHVKADVAVRGDAGTLYLLLNRRVAADDPAVEIHGDRSTLDTWLERTIF
jgi:uncharacterized protein (TIGR03083 family)